MLGFGTSVRRVGRASTTSDTGDRERRQFGAGFASLLTLFVVLLPMVAGLAACGPLADAGSGLAVDQTLTWPYFGTNELSVAVFDPALTTFSVDSQNVFALYSGLVTFDTSLHVVPDEAASWDIGGDGAQKGTIYTFHLRPDLHFSDGTPLTAEDFAYSIDRALDPHLCDKQSSATYAANGVCAPGSEPGPTYLAHILGANSRVSGAVPTLIGHGDGKKGLNVIDPQTLQIRLDAPIAYFIQTLTYPTAFPLERKLLERYPDGRWVQHLDEGGTNGPFKVAGFQKQPGLLQRLIMEPDPYWQRPDVKPLTLKKLIRPLYATEDDEYTDYRAGKLDVTDVPAKNYFGARSQGDFYEVALLATTYFGLNLDAAPFTQSDPNSILIRRALALALNKQLLVDRIENGGALPSNHILPRGMPGFSENLTNPPPDGTQALTGNQKVAQKLLKQARDACSQVQEGAAQPASCPYITGSSPRPIELHVSQSRQTRVDLSNFAAAQWNDTLGLNIKVVVDDVNTFRANYHRGGPYQLWIIGWLADYADPQDWLSVLFSCHASTNYDGYCNPTLDRLLGKADVEPDFTKRLAMYQSAEQTVVNDVAWIPFEQAKYAWRQKPWVRGFGLTPLQTVAVRTWANVYIAAHQ
jgi:oligopeptide transport system substrate-binding protein